MARHLGHFKCLHNGGLKELLRSHSAACAENLLRPLRMLGDRESHAALARSEERGLHLPLGQGPLGPGTWAHVKAQGPWALGPLGPWTHGQGPWAQGLWTQNPKNANHKKEFRLRKKSTDLPDGADRSVSSRRYD